MAVSSVLSFWLVAAMLIVVPGPDWAFAVSAGLRRQVVPAASGIVLGYLAMTAVVAAGVGYLIAASPLALTVLTLVGGAYLVWLGIGIARHPVVAGADDGAPAGSRAIIIRGMAVSGLNPKGLLIFVALLPQFSDSESGWPIPIQLAALGLVFVGTCAAVYLCVAGAAHRLLNPRPTAARVVSRLSGVSMAAVGCVLLVEHVAV